MAADTTTLTEKMRAALRISSTSEKITEEINDCIAACKADMKNDGVKVIKETDGLIIRAITLYCKAEFGFNNAAEQFRKSYDALKNALIFISRIQHSAASVRNGHQQHRKWGVKRWSGWTN